MEHLWNDTDKGQQKYLEKSCPSATFSTTDLTCTGMRWNPALLGKRPVTNGMN